MKIHYRIHNNFIEIIRCYGTDAEVVLPEMIDGYPVREIAAYTFSAKKSLEEEDVLIYNTEESSLFDMQEHLLAGEEVRRVVFPDTVERIGNYIFYGCKELRQIAFSDALVSVGSGAFTGCGKLNCLDVRMKQGQKSCVKEILGDLWQRIDVIFRYDSKVTAGGEKPVKMVFPEHYEEAVENTPARILFTRHHGTGNNYRQCFYNKELDYRKYDELFSIAKAQDNTAVLADMAFYRLRDAWELQDVHRSAYETYLREHLAEVARLAVEKEQMERLKFFRREEFFRENEYALDEAVTAAQENKNGEMLSFLMDIRRELFPKKKRKRFEL